MMIKWRIYYSSLALLKPSVCALSSTGSTTADADTRFLYQRLPLPLFSSGCSFDEGLGNMCYTVVNATIGYKFGDEDRFFTNSTNGKLVLPLNQTENELVKGEYQHKCVCLFCLFVCLFTNA